MINENTALWKKIATFPFDEPNASFPFSKKLAKQQNWSESFTHKVIEEYRRFMYLCCISPTGASPSEIVDEVWHLHLTYTRNYWKEFCQQTLEKDIHHHPSKGGTAEHHKHRDWYRETLLLYETVFKEKPPESIWPKPIPDEHPVVQPTVPEIDSTQTILAICSIFTVPFLIAFFTYGTCNPYHLKGPQFLTFFFCFSLAIIGSLIWLLKQRQPSIKALVETMYPKQYTIYQAVYFLYGKHRALQTAIIDLLKKDILSLNDDRTFTNHISSSGNIQSTNPLLKKLRNMDEDAKLSYETLECLALDEEDLKHPAFDQLAAISKKKNRSQWIFFFIGLLLAISRMVQGWSITGPLVSWHWVPFCCFLFIGS